MRKRPLPQQGILGNLGDDGKGKILLGREKDNHQLLLQQLSRLLRSELVRSFELSSMKTRC